MYCVHIFSFYLFISGELSTEKSKNISSKLIREKRSTSEDQPFHNWEPVYEEEYDQLEVVLARWFAWGVRILIVVAILLAFLMCFCACLKYPCLLIGSQLKSRCFHAFLDCIKGRNVKYQRLRRGLEDMEIHLDYETYLLINESIHKSCEKKKADRSKISYQRLET